MNREDIIRMAEEQGLVDYFDLDGDSVGQLMLRTLVFDCIAAEREKCEKVCGAVSNLVAAIETVGIPNVGARKVLNKACEDALKCVDDIRARGQE